jgi:hypothetical protein
MVLGDDLRLGSGARGAAVLGDQDGLAEARQAVAGIAAVPDQLGQQGLTAMVGIDADVGERRLFDDPRSGAR